MIPSSSSTTIATTIATTGGVAGNPQQLQQQQYQQHHHQLPRPFAVGFTLGGLLPNGWLAYWFHQAVLLANFPADPILSKTSGICSAVLIVLLVSSQFPKKDHCEVWTGAVVGFAALAMIAEWYDDNTDGPSFWVPFGAAMVAILNLALAKKKSSSSERKIRQLPSQESLSLSSSHLDEPLLVQAV